TGITMPITKHNCIVKDVSQLADAIRNAFFIANDGRKGPVLIDIPKDITAAKCDYEPKKPRKHIYSANSSEIIAAAELISRSARPFIYAGGGAVSCDAYNELAKFAEIIDAPVSLSLMGQCAFDNTSSRYTGMMGMHGTKTSSLALTECDLLIVLGSRFSDRVTCNSDTFRKAAGRAKILHIDIDPAEINKNIAADAKVHGDVKLILKNLNEMLIPRKRTEWMSLIAEWKKQYPLHQVSENENTVLPQEVLETLNKLTDGKAIISTEVGQHQMWTAEFYNFRNPRSFASSGGLGTMGYGLGAAIGCKVGNPDKVVVNCAGDGSFYMNMNELTTLAKYQLPVIELVFNNSVLGMVRQWQKLFYNNHFSHTTLENPPDFELLGKALGIEAMTISKRDDIRPVLEKAIAINKPVLINCIIDKDINVLPMVPAGASIAEPILEIK
ncbi:MAG: acetolactate synthase large subunit, partial [Oscillospiraceae bacterium]|nr:acetolactate synthase large subunit [Oscillospiraceae bacterium]